MFESHALQTSQSGSYYATFLPVCLLMLEVNALANDPDVARLRDIDANNVAGLLSRFGLVFTPVPVAEAIPGSFWGDDEAGLIGNALFARPDTPLHSILHEACHWISCTPNRRAALHTDAADTQEEENATCYLQILLSDHIPGFGRARGLKDMDAWGYSFRLGTAAQWFSQDAQSEREWLQHYQLIDTNDRPSFRVREF